MFIFKFLMKNKLKIKKPLLYIVKNNFLLNIIAKVFIKNIFLMVNG